MQQEVVLAMLAKEPSQGYQLRARMNDALGPLGEALNAGQVYVTLGRLEKAGLVAVEETPESTGPADRDRKVSVLPAAGQLRVAEWLAEVSWPKPDLAEFHLKLIAAAAARLADPIGIVDAQRRELLRRLRDAQRAEMDGAEEDAMTVGAAPLLHAHGLRKEYGKDEGFVRAVDDVDLEVARGETLAIMGPSGCGKSTLLHLLGGLDRPSGGELSLNGRR